MDISSLEQLAFQVGEQLKNKGWYLATAESCTGGWIAQVITANAGSSEWFDRGFVTYSNAAKQEMLGVSDKTLTLYGAVSEPVVVEMVEGAIIHSAAQVALAVSGIAGPGGGTEEKPVGTVWIAWKLPFTVFTQSYQFLGERQQVREQTVFHALSVLLKKLRPEMTAIIS